MREQGQLVYTIKESCRVCYTCVRECPAKAIRIISGQAEVVGKRCIGCGNCVKVCSQGAKVFTRSVEEVEQLINSEKRVVACIAPSFPAEFSEIKDHHFFVGMIKALGFDYVNEVAFGADLVAAEYQKILENKNSVGHISSDCPAIVSYVERYHPDLVPALAPIVSPMVASARVVRTKYGDDVKVVFIGPCIAKKDESDEVDQVLTFKELRQMFYKKSITPETAVKSDFDSPKAGKGSIFPVSRGLLQTVDLSENLFEGNIVVADGRINFQDAIKEFENGLLKSHHLELLCCEGCIMGPGMSSVGERYARRSYIQNFVSKKLGSIDLDQWKKDVEEYSLIDLKQTFNKDDQRIPRPEEHEVKNVLISMGKKDPKDYLNCGACGYDSCEDHAIAIIKGLAESEMCLPSMIEKLHNSIYDLAISNEKLASVQQALKHSEKLAHMGQLSAGIAHELNNPLGVVMMYSNLLLDECNEESNIKDDLKLIVDQVDRCKKIVGGLLNFARGSQLNYSAADILDLVQQSIKSVIIPANINVEVKSSVKSHFISIDIDQMIQVISNLLKNAIEAMPEGGDVKIIIEDSISEVSIKIRDTGTGIGKENLDKIFEPFFTTKGIGKGTGLGLAIIYGIIKMHKGQISVESNADADLGKTGTTFKIVLPRK